tara:strand:- start:820 stop:1386 length:567 start_codon:yes stop_codon:yes gene_type:complete
MLITHDHDNKEIWLKLRRELKLALKDSNHPFRYLILGSAQGDLINQRYVVLRDMDDDLNLYVFSDARTQKVKDFERNSNCSALFYHPEERIQVRVIAKTEILNSLGKQAYWKTIQGVSVKAYSSVKSPGTPVQEWEEAYKWDKSIGFENFSVIRIIPQEIEMLQLNKLEHLRIRFSRSNDWKGQKLVP